MEDISSRKVIRLAATVDRQEVDRIVPGTQPVERGRWLQLKLFKKKCFHSYSALVIDYFIFRYVDAFTRFHIISSGTDL